MRFRAVCSSHAAPIRVNVVESAPGYLEAVHGQFSGVLTIVHASLDVAEYGGMVLREQRLEGCATIVHPSPSRCHR
ncbi:hypothetical protein [Microbacterium sp. W4I4]|uniref:hypothetical protein n=1 Tax=Microbacterium sp. W4I4 TaxID=3042295 RepID=UPI0027D82C24|nr:hypothetical protein [Microbacterium sp. W4I4]